MHTLCLYLLTYAVAVSSSEMSFTLFALYAIIIIPKDVTLMGAALPYFEYANKYANYNYGFGCNHFITELEIFKAEVLGRGQERRHAQERFFYATSLSSIPIKEAAWTIVHTASTFYKRYYIQRPLGFS
jgi:hypothetical protein